MGMRWAWRRIFGAFFEQDYLRHAAAAGLSTSENGVSRVELLFCARSEADEGLEIARRVAVEYPEVTTRFVTSGLPGCECEGVFPGGDGEGGDA